MTWWMWAFVAWMAIQVPLGCAVGRLLSKNASGSEEDR